MSVIERPNEAGLWYLDEHRFAYLTQSSSGRLSCSAWRGICDASDTTLGDLNTHELPTGNWRKLTAPAAPSPEVKPFTPTKSTWQAGKEFKAWLESLHVDDSTFIAEKALKIFSECGTAQPDAFPPRPAFVAPERPDTLIRQKSDGFECWASKRAGGYCAGPWCYSFDSVDVINPATGEPLAPAEATQ